MIQALNNVAAINFGSGEDEESGNVVNWYAKLRRITQKIHVAKGAMNVRKLNERQASAATILIHEIERCVENLGQNATSQNGHDLGEWIPTCVRINNQLDDLNLLSEELVMAVASAQ